MNKGRWPLPTRIKRDFDIWDVEVSPCLAQNPRGLWAPSLGPLKNFVKITIEASGETSKALRLIGERNTVELEPLIHFPLIIEKIKWESETKYKNSVL